MYGTLKFLYENLAESATITLSSQANGKYSYAAKEGKGVASMTVGGVYSGTNDRTYLVECDSVSAGSEIGQATVRWRSSDTAGAWEQTGVVTMTTPVTTLEDGLTISFQGGTGTDFVVGDSWQFYVKATYGFERLLDRNRMTGWKSTGDTSENIVIDAGGAVQKQALILQDHNLTASATVIFEENPSDSWGAPSYTFTFPTITDPLILYFDEIYQYSRINIADPSNPEAVIRINNLFLGTVLSLERLNAEWGSSQQEGYILQKNESEAGVSRRYKYAGQRTLHLNFGNLLSNEDKDALVTMQNALVLGSQVAPLWCHLFSDEQSALNLMTWDNLGEWTFEYFRYLLNSGVEMILEEVPKV